MTTHLREELSALADTQTFSPDPSAWDRGRRGVEGEAAIPSVIPEPDGPVVTDLTIGRASVAYVDAATGMPVLVDAATGSASFVNLPDFPEQSVLELTADLYPDGAAVAPVGWADNSLLVAQVDAPEGNYVEGQHLALLTSPDRPESEWTYRILLTDMPSTTSISLAVDLVPDLDGTSSQELTRDFSASPDGDSWRGALPYALGGLMALLSGLAFIRMMRSQA